MDPRRKKQIGIATLVIVIVALIIYGFWPKPIQVDTGIVSRGPMQLTIEEEGKTRVKDRYTLSSPVSGILQRIELEAGDQVLAGTVVARIQPAAPELLNDRQYAITEARLNATQASLEQARENLRLTTEEAAYTEKELNRIQNLRQTGVGSVQNLDQATLANQRAQANKSSAEFGVRVAESELESARAALQWSQRTQTTDDLLVIRSPVEGTVLSVSNESEHPVLTGESLMEIGDPQSLEIRADLLSSDAVQVQPSTKVLIKRWGGDCILEGSVRVVEPAGYTKISALGVEEQRVPVIVDIASDHELWTKLGDGYRVVAEFILWEGENVLQVSTSALFRTGEEWALFTLENGYAHRKTVTIGHQTGLNTEILGGLEEGEIILTHPDEQIEDGVRVEARS